MILYVNELKGVLKCSRLKVYKLMNESNLAEYMMKIGGKYAIDERDLEKWLASQKLVKNEATV
jgi:excisionase family DNA binding protein